jgi:integrative and conjugative element protein (TIGR02256 family)
LVEAKVWADTWDPLEVGGVLAGYVHEAEIVITHLVGPGAQAAHTPESFLPDHAFHVAEIARIYGESAGACTYLGDWHTHPGGLPRLSATDRSTLRYIAQDPEARCPEPVMMVLAGREAQWEAAVFLQAPKRKSWSREMPVTLRAW